MAQKYEAMLSTLRESADFPSQATAAWSSPCTICGKTTTLQCQSCHAAHYYSRDCQGRDWGFHKILCKEYCLLFPRPAPSYKLALVFPVESNTLRLEYINCPMVIDEVDGVYEKPDISSLLGNDHPLVGRGVVGSNRLRGFEIGHTLSIYFRDDFLKDESKRNKSIIASTKGALFHTWNGPCVVMRTPRADSYSDVTLMDLRSAVDYVSDDLNNAVEGLEVRVQDEKGKVAGVQINCAADRVVSGAAEYAAIGISLSHAIFFHVHVPHISQLLEIPIHVYTYTPDYIRRNHGDAEADLEHASRENVPATCLMTNVNPTSGYWSLAVPQWRVDDLRSLLVVRKDRKRIAPRQIEALCSFFIKLQPLFEDSYGAGRVERTKAEVIAFMTRPELRNSLRSTRQADLRKIPCGPERSHPMMIEDIWAPKVPSKILRSPTRAL